jgi:hypothetical protein
MFAPEVCRPWAAALRAVLGSTDVDLPEHPLRNTVKMIIAATPQRDLLNK